MGDVVDEAAKAVEGLTEFALAKHKSKTKKTSKVEYLNCVVCGEEIPQARRNAVKGVKHCINCQEELEDDIVA